MKRKSSGDGWWRLSQNNMNILGVIALETEKLSKPVLCYAL
jgi:hypothetical protein